MKNFVKVCVGLFFLVNVAGVYAMQESTEKSVVQVVKSVEDYRRQEVEKFKTGYLAIRSDIDKIFKIAYVAAKQICNQQSYWKTMSEADLSLKEKGDGCADRSKEQYKTAYEVCEKVKKWYKKIDFDSQRVISGFEAFLSSSKYEEISSDYISCEFLKPKQVTLYQILLTVECDWASFSKEYQEINQLYKDTIKELKEILSINVIEDSLEGEGVGFFKSFRDGVWVSFESLEHDIVDFRRLLVCKFFDFNKGTKESKIEKGIDVGQEASIALPFKDSLRNSEDLLEKLRAVGLKFDENYGKSFFTSLKRVGNDSKGSTKIDNTTSWSIIKIVGTLTLSVAAIIAIFIYRQGYFQKIYSGLYEDLKLRAF